MDYVIVGGGVYGCGLALRLAQAGAGVMLLEAETVARGASGGPGMRGVRANGRDLRELRLMARSYELWKELDQELGGVTRYEQIGGLELIENERDLARGLVQAATQTRLGVASRFLDRGELLDLEPELAPEIRGAVYSPFDGVADHTATTLGLQHAAERARAIVRERTPVRSIETRDGRVVAVETAFGERIPVHVGLILTANRAVPDLLATCADVRLPVWSRLPQVLISAPMGTVPVRHLIGHMSRRLALKPLPGGRVMISGGRLGMWDAEQDSAAARDEEVTANLADARAVYPTLERISVETVSVDRWETESVDGIPIIDRIPGTENALFATGWSGHGWAPAPALIELIRDWTLSGVTPAALKPFLMSRFDV